MATKQLRTSGGDYSTLDSYLNYLHAVGTLTEDETLYVQAGQYFSGTLPVVAYPDHDLAGAGFQIVITTDPSDDIETDGPGAISSNYQGFSTASGNIDVVFRNVIFAQDSSGNVPFGSYDDNDVERIDIRFENSWILYKGFTGQALFNHSVMSNGGNSLYIQNCMFCVWNSGFYGNGDVLANPISTSNTSGAYVTNNTFLEYYADPSGTYDEFQLFMNATTTRMLNNTVQSLSTPAGVTTFTSNSPAQGSPTEANNSIGTMGYGTILATATDEVSGVIGRIQAGAAKIGLGNTLVRDNADSDYLLAGDYIGTSRPRGRAGDRGPYEYIPVANAVTASTPDVAAPKIVFGIPADEAKKRLDKALEEQKNRDRDNRQVTD